MRWKLEILTVCFWNARRHAEAGAGILTCLDMALEGTFFLGKWWWQGNGNVGAESSSCVHVEGGAASSPLERASPAECV
jgi:hypothetical protein